MLLKSMLVPALAGSLMMSAACVLPARIAPANEQLPASEVSLRAVFEVPRPDRKFVATVGSQSRAFELEPNARVIKDGRLSQVGDLRRGDALTISLSPGSMTVAMHVEAESMGAVHP